MSGRKSTLFLFAISLAGTVCSADRSQPNGYLGMSLPADFRAFGEDSPWNATIPENAEVDPDSDSMISTLRTHSATLKADYTRWTVPLFVIDREECPKIKVRTTSERFDPGVDPDGDAIAENIPIPAGVWPDPEEDGHMLLVDPVARQTWDFSCAKRLSAKEWTASRLDTWDLDGPGFRPAFSGDHWWTCGARGSGMPLIAGLVRIEEIAAGEIRHALVFACPVNRRSLTPGGPLELNCPTASRTDGQGVGPEYIPEGALLQLDPTLDLALLGLSPSATVVARALQEYGMYDGDNAETFKLYFQNLGADGAQWRSAFDFADLEKIPVQRFRVIRGTRVVKE